MRQKNPETYEEKLAQLEELRQAGRAPRLREGGREAARQRQVHRARADREAARPGLLPGARHLRAPPHAATSTWRRTGPGATPSSPATARSTAAASASSRRTSPSSAARSARSWPRRCARSWTWRPRSAARSSASTTPAARASRRASSRSAPTATSSCATSRCSGVIPQISLIMGPCAGGAVYSPAITDFIFMVKETSHMFITGPDVIKTVTGEEVDFEELGGAMSHNSKSGVAHFAVRRRGRSASRTRATCCSFLPQNNLETPPRVAAVRRPDADGRRRSTRVVPDNPNKPYDMRDVVRLIVDDGEFFEVHEHYAKNIVCGFSRLDGYAVGVVGNQPRADGRRARHRRLREGRALRAHLRRVQHPAADLRRRPRLPARAPRRSGAASSATARSCSTPTPRRRSRRSPSSRARPTAAPTTSWRPSTCSPTSTSPGRRPRSRSWGPRARSTSSTAATSPARRRPTQRRAKLIDDYKARFANPYAAAERGYVDDVIDPARDAPEAHRRAGDAADQARARPAAQARQHPAVTWPA